MQKAHSKLRLQIFKLPERKNSLSQALTLPNWLKGLSATSHLRTFSLCDSMVWQS